MMILFQLVHYIAVQGKTTSKSQIVNVNVESSFTIVNVNVNVN